MKPSYTISSSLRKILPLIIALTLQLLVSHQPVLAQQSKDSLKVALVLSGGGAKGLAQIGVFNILEAESVRPDLITGTSIGSILGGLYAIGYSIGQLEDLANGTDWLYYFDDELERRYFPIYERGAAERYQIRFTLDNGKINFPIGVVRGKKISLLLSRLTIPAHGIHDFDDFEIPFRGVATDLETGQAVSYGEGDLADVMRASMSIPSVFVPFEIGDKILIDGGVARNLPVQDALDLGADKVIAIDIGAPLYKKEDITSILDVLDQTSSFRIVESNKEQTALADVVVKPRIDDISALTFDKNKVLMMKGKVATHEKVDEINALFPYKKPLATRGVVIPEEVELVDFEIKGCSDKELKTVNNLLQIQICKTYTLDQIENRIKELYGSELVALANYRLIPDELEDGYKLIINVQPQRGEFVRLSANYDSRLKAALLLNLTLRNRLISGSKFNVDLKVSENPSLDIDYFVNTSTRPNVGWHLGVRGNFYPGLTYVDEKKGDLFGLRHFSTTADIFSTFDNRFLVSAGIGLERYVRSEEFFDPDRNELRLNQAFIQGRFLRDNFDREHFPTAGSYLELLGKYPFERSLRLPDSDSTSTINSDNAMLRLQAIKAFSAGKKLTPIMALDAGYIHRAENNYLHQFYLGRSLPGEMTHVGFMGLRYMELPVSTYLAGQLKFQLEPVTDIFTSLVFNGAFFQTKNLELIDGLPTDLEIIKEDYIMGTGLELGMHTRLGPATFNVEYNWTEERFNFWMHLGHLF